MNCSNTIYHHLQYNYFCRIKMLKPDETAFCRFRQNWHFEKEMFEYIK